MKTDNAIPDHHRGECGEWSADPHPCPFDLEIGGGPESEFECTCCINCENECADDI